MNCICMRWWEILFRLIGWLPTCEPFEEILLSVRTLFTSFFTYVECGRCACVSLKYRQSSWWEACSLWYSISISITIIEQRFLHVRCVAVFSFSFGRYSWSSFHMFEVVADSIFKMFCYSHGAHGAQCWSAFAMIGTHDNDRNMQDLRGNKWGCALTFSLVRIHLDIEFMMLTCTHATCLIRFLSVCQSFKRWHSCYCDWIMLKCCRNLIHKSFNMNPHWKRNDWQHHL